MSTFLLVHGAWMGAWCWDKVILHLQNAGHKVVAQDLPSHGQDQTPIAEISLQAYTERIISLLDASAEPVVLVAHSVGGIVISQVAEARPDKIKSLVYLTAYLLPDGQSILSSSDSDSQIPTIIEIRQAEGVAALNAEGMPAVFFDDCSQEDIDLALSHLRPDSLAPLATPVAVTEANFGRVPRFYIECLQDRVISPTKQREMYTGLPCQKVVSLNSSHSAFLSRPAELAEHLLAF